MTPYDVPRRRRSRPDDDEDRTGGTGSASPALLAQVLAELQALREDVSHAATKDDLSRLVSKETYDTQRVADQQIAAITAGRLTNIESSVNALKDDFHRFQLQDATRIGQLATTTTQQIGQAAQGAQAGISAVQARTADLIAKGQQMLIGALASGFVALLIYALGHH